MNMVDEKEFFTVKETVTKLEDKIKDFDIFLKHCRGQPIIEASAAKRFDLNDNLNVIELLKRIKSLESLKVNVIKTAFSSSFSISSAYAGAVLVCNNAVPISVTFPSAIGSGDTYEIFVKGSGSVEAIAVSGQTINGDASQIMYQWDAIKFYDWAPGEWIAGL